MDLTDLSRVLLAFLAVVGFIAAAAFAVRSMGLAAGARALSRERRLSLVEALPIDARRRAIILRCDGREHLLILGQTGEMLVESNLPPRAQSDAGEADDAAPPFAGVIANLTKFAGRKPMAPAKDAEAA